MSTESFQGVGRAAISVPGVIDGKPSASAPLDPYQLAQRRIRDAIKDKTYRAYPMGGEAAEYLRWKRGRLTPASYRDYEGCLDKLAREFPDLEITDFEPPVGTERLEEFLDHTWGESAPRTYNKNLSVVKDFFKFAVLKGKLHGDPSLPLVPHKKRDVHRTTFSDADCQRIISDGPSPDLKYHYRDKVALRLLLKYGIRKGALQSAQYRHFDRERRRLTIFTKGEKVRELPLVDDALWQELDRAQMAFGAGPDDYLMCSRKVVPHGYNPDGTPHIDTYDYPHKPMSDHGLHNWWYQCLERAGVVDAGTTSGSKMHMARHTAGQALLDHTGNLKAVQRLLGHSSIQTTGDIYTDWDLDALAASMRELGE